MRILVTGASGYLGGRLVPALRARGHTVTPSARRALGPIVALDILDRHALTIGLDGHDAVLHLASLDEHEAARDPAQALLVSGEGTRLVLETAARLGVPRVVFLSTYHIYGLAHPALVDEDVAPRAAHPYAIAHLAGEGYCRAAARTGHPQAIVLRLSNVYGAPADRSVDRWTLAHNDLCRQAAENGRIVLRGDGSDHRDLVWVEDVATAIDLVLAARPESLGEGVFNVGGDRILSVGDLAQYVSKRARAILGRDVPVDRGVSDTAPRAPFRYAIDRVAALGYVPRDGLQRETDEVLRLIATREAVVR